MQFTETHPQKKQYQTVNRCIFKGELFEWISALTEVDEMTDISGMSLYNKTKNQTTILSY